MVIHKVAVNKLRITVVLNIDRAAVPAVLPVVLVVTTIIRGITVGVVRTIVPAVPPVPVRERPRTCLLARRPRIVAASSTVHRIRRSVTAVAAVST